MAVALKNNVVLSRSSDRTMRAMGKVIGYGNRSTALAKRKTQPAGSVSIPELGQGAQPEWLGKKVLAALGLHVPRVNSPAVPRRPFNRGSDRLSGGNQGAGGEA